MFKKCGTLEVEVVDRLNFISKFLRSLGIAGKGIHKYSIM